MTPVAPRPAGTGTSNGYPLTWFVTGHANAKPDLALYIFGLNTSAGRRPAGQIVPHSLANLAKEAIIAVEDA